MRTALALVLCVALSACGKKVADAAGADAAAAATRGPAAAVPAAAGPTFVTAVSALRREPTDAQKIPGPTGKDIPNYLALLHRGEVVSVLETKEDWVKVRSSGDTDGWLKRTSVLDAPGAALATVTSEQDLFDRPELLAGNNRKLAPGTLLFVLKTKTPFAEVNVTGASSAWVLADRIATGEKEVTVAKLAEKARWLVKSGKRDEAVKVLGMARQHFADVPLTEALATELGEPPAGAVVVPAAGELPPGAPAPDATTRP
jgi:SH3-like domain-containing protein